MGHHSRLTSLRIRKKVDRSIKGGRGRKGKDIKYRN